MSGKMVYQMYRNSVIGNALYETLDILCSDGIISHSLAIKILDEFDKAISAALAACRLITYITGKLSSYRCCEEVWTF